MREIVISVVVVFFFVFLFCSGRKGEIFFFCFSSNVIGILPTWTSMRPRERRLAIATTWFFSFYSVGSNLRRDDKFQWRVVGKGRRRRDGHGPVRLMYIYT